MAEALQAPPPQSAAAQQERLNSIDQAGLRPGAHIKAEFMIQRFRLQRIRPKDDRPFQTTLTITGRAKGKKLDSVYPPR